MEIWRDCERTQQKPGREAAGSRRRDDGSSFLQGVATRSCGAFLEASNFLGDGDPIQSLVRENGSRPEDAQSFHFGTHFGTQGTCGRYGL